MSGRPGLMTYVVETSPRGRRGCRMCTLRREARAKAALFKVRAGPGNLHRTISGVSA